MKYLTIRDIPPEIAEALEKEKHRRGKSLNETVIQLLGKSLGVHPHRSRVNGMARLAGTWTPEEYDQFEAAVSPAGQIDEELWR